MPGMKAPIGDWYRYSASASTITWPTATVPTGMPLTSFLYVQFLWQLLPGTTEYCVSLFRLIWVKRMRRWSAG